MGNSQLLSNQLVSLQERDSAFESVSDKFNIIVPDGWVIQDVYNTDTISLLEEMLQGSRLLAQICPQGQAIIDTEKTYDCEESGEKIYIQQYPNLADQPEFASIANNNIGNENLLDYYIMKLRKLGYSEISILRNINMTINVINSDTNKTTVSVVPASVLEMRYNSPNSTDTRGYVMLAATNATSNLGIISGYSLSYEANAATLPSIFPPEPILGIFQSFELVKDAGEGGLGALNVQDNDYGNDALTSIGRPTGNAEHPLSPSLASGDQTTNQTEATESCKPLMCFRDMSQ
ncbi:MAG: hypothetical protein M3251_02085 [Thermoproteota archaeon]|nr:hypothetical protein [Thermoproteota archaeon]